MLWICWWKHICGFPEGVCARWLIDIGRQRAPGSVWLQLRACSTAAKSGEGAAAETLLPSFARGSADEAPGKQKAAVLRFLELADPYREVLKQLHV